MAVGQRRGPHRPHGARPPLQTVVALALLTLAACDGGPRSVAEGVGEPIVLDSTDVRVLGTSESIAEVRDLEVLPDGSVWLLNSLEPFFVGFGPEGALLGIHGSEGGGPEEYRFPSSLVAGGIDGEAWVFDLRRHALVEVSEPESAWSEMPLPRDALPPGSLMGGMDMMSPIVRTARLGDEIVLPRTTGSMDDGLFSFRLAILGADLLALDPATDSVRTVVALGDVLDDPAAGFERTDGGVPLWYRLWAACGDDRIRVHDRVRNELRTFGPDGAELEPVALPPVRLTSVTPRQFARAVFPLREAEITGAVGRELTSADSARALNEMAQSLQGTPEQLAAYLPRYVDLRCGDDGDVWMQPLDLERGGLAGGPAWLRVAPDGTTDEVHMPARFDPYRFTGGRIWGVQRDELDVASVAWIEEP